VKSLLQENVSLAPWTTFGVGGTARYFLDASSESDVRTGLDFAQSHRLPLFVLGGGSNLLIADRGFPGLVLRISLKGMQWEDGKDLMLLSAGAGEDWDEIVAACVQRDLGGVECLSGIPGLVGGTPVQNVGAYGQEIADVLTGVSVLDRDSGLLRELTREDCRFEYRRSIFNTTQRNRYIVLNVRYALKKHAVPCIRYPDLVRRFDGAASAPTLDDVRQAVRAIRASKGMLIVEGDPDCRSAGSFFKNPIIDEAQFSRLQSSAAEAVPRYPAPSGFVGKIKTSAAWLIERAGYKKGFSIGPAAVSSKHTLALVNTGGATAADILRLAHEIQRGVEERFGIRLAPEPVLVGFDEEGA
jgi:UDP-N-acetylmuramate dehydrogenase